MANVKISDLTAATTVAGANEFEINEAGSSKKVTGTQISSFVEGNLGLGALATADTVGTTEIDNLAVTTGKIAADAIDGTKIADDAIDSEHIAADSIDAEHYASGSVDATALNVTGNGTSGQVLQSDGDGSFSWGSASTSFSGWDIYRNGAVNITSGAWRLLILNGNNYKTSDMNYDAATGKITPQKAGYYIMTTEYNSNVKTYDRTAIYKNGSALKYGRFNNDSNSSNGGGIVAIGYANGSTDYFQVYTFVGATRTLNTGATNTWFSGAYLGA